jgi:hypothetical protein
MDNIKAMKQMLSDGKKKAYFETNPNNKSIERSNKKAKREQSLIDMINVSGSGVLLSKIELLEKQLREGNYLTLISLGSMKRNLSDYQRKILEDKLKQEILNEK